nr:hypothetical protein [Leptospira noguchii]
MIWIRQIQRNIRKWNAHKEALSQTLRLEKEGGSSRAGERSGIK